MARLFSALALARLAGVIAAAELAETEALVGIDTEEACALQVNKASAKQAKLGPLTPSPTPAPVTCKPVTTQPNVDLAAYISKTWYIQQQMVVAYLPADSFYCVTASYEGGEPPTRHGYTIKVMNYAQNENSTARGGELCAYEADSSDLAKLAVAPCFLPKFAAGPYWILAYNEEEGYALVSGGQPTIPTADGCQTGMGVNNAGLWIFAREPTPPQALVMKVRGIAKMKGFDLSVLKEVIQEGCDYSVPVTSENRPFPSM